MTLRPIGTAKDLHQAITAAATVSLACSPAFAPAPVRVRHAAARDCPASRKGRFPSIRRTHEIALDLAARTVEVGPAKSIVAFFVMRGWMTCPRPTRPWLRARAGAICFQTPRLGNGPLLAGKGGLQIEKKCNDSRLRSWNEDGVKLGTRAEE